MSSLCWLDDFHVSSHNLFRCRTATLQPPALALRNHVPADHGVDAATGANAARGEAAADVTDAGVDTVYKPVATLAGVGCVASDRRSNAIAGEGAAKYSRLSQIKTQDPGWWP